MTELEFDGSDLVVHVMGLDKFWALRSILRIPAEHVTKVSYDPDAARGWYHGFKFPGSNLPGVLTAGTFIRGGERTFWDVHHPEQAIVINLTDEPYHRLIVEVANPQLEVERLNGLIKLGN